MNIEPIGTLSSCFKEKFGIPRQPGLVPEARAILTLKPLPEMRRALRGLEGFSHVWILFLFHRAAPGWKPVIRPPRLDGKRTVGVFASRSPHRPNPIGISAVELERIEERSLQIHLKGVDFLDGTPVIDLKPYLPYADAIPRARTGWADLPSAKLQVRFEAPAARVCRANPGLRKLVAQILSLDPRPAFQRNGADAYAAKVMNFDVHWVTEGDRCTVREIKELRPFP